MPFDCIIVVVVMYIYLLMNTCQMPSLLSDEDYGIVKTRDALGLENLTEEEEIWMVQCPVSVSVYHDYVNIFWLTLI
jgi:hypothetical protein